MIQFANTNKSVIAEVYEQMDSMLGHIKDIVQPKDAIIYDNHKHVVKRWDNLNVPPHALAYVLTPKYYSPYWLAKPTPGVRVRKKSHTYPKVQNGYMIVLAKLVLDEEENAILHSELSKYLNQHGPFSSLYVNKDRDKSNPIEWWNMYGSHCTHLRRLEIKVFSQVVNSSSVERCCST